MNFLMEMKDYLFTDSVVSFANTDSAKLYYNNISKFGIDWRYATTPITYKFNRLGYRMKQLEEVNYDNYYAFFGCSYTVGIGLQLEDTFAHKIAQRANVDYVNASVSACGPDLVYYNFLKLMQHAPKKPKIIFINWPSIHRAFYLDDDAQPILMLPKCIPSCHWRKTYIDFITMDHQVFNRFEIIRNSVSMICQLAGIPLFEMSTHQDHKEDYFKNAHPTVITDIQLVDFDSPNLKQDSPKYLHMNYARDIEVNNNRLKAHPGFIHQTAIVNRFFEEMQ